MTNPETRIVFGGDHRLAGWFTPGVGNEDQRGCAVLLCPPVGHEYMCSYRAFRVLARDLAKKGFPVLRFDYYGTGDSDGPATSESLVPSWVESISLAADELKRLSGCEKVVLAGLRLGAALAAMAAGERDDVDSLILWSPCASGRSLLRQTRMLAVAAAARPDDLADAAEGIESVGFFFNSKTAADIARIKLDVGVEYSASHALVLTRDDAPSEAAVLGTMATAGVDCEEKTYSDHATFLVAPTESVLPKKAIQTIVQWLEENYAAAGDQPAAASHAAASAAMFPDGVRESAVAFADGRLAAVVVEPPAANSSGTAIVLLNSGAYHHVGPHRMYVPLARRWAAMGFCVMRLDLYGIGDSGNDDGRPLGESYPPSALEDIRDAITYLRDSKGYDQVILAGMCSGAYHAVYGADLDVTAVIAVNPPLFHHAGDPIVPDPHYDNQANAERVMRSLLDPAKWRRLLSGRVDTADTLKVLARRVYQTVQTTGSAARQMIGRDAPERRDPVTLFRDDVPMHLIFNEGDKSQVFFDRILSRPLDHLRQSGTITVEVVAGADHTFTALRWQRVLAELMTRRLLQYRAAQAKSSPRPESTPEPKPAARESFART